MLNDNEKLNKGYVAFYRSFIVWEWFTDVNTCHLFQYCILRANHSDSEWRGIKVKRGSFITSLENLAISTGLTVRQVRTAIKKLKMTGELTHKATNHYSIITVNNYCLYQDNNNQNDERMTIKRQTNDKRMTTDNNEVIMNNNEIINNNIGDKNKNFIIPSLEEIKSYCFERNNNVDANRFYDYYSSKGWMVGKNKMKDWKAAVRTWERNNFSTNAIKEQKQEADEVYNYGF